MNQLRCVDCGFYMECYVLLCRSVDGKSFVVPEFCPRRKKVMKGD